MQTEVRDKPLEWEGLEEEEEEEVKQAMGIEDGANQEDMSEGAAGLPGVWVGGN